MREIDFVPLYRTSDRFRSKCRLIAASTVALLLVVAVSAFSCANFTTRPYSRAEIDEALAKSFQFLHAHAHFRATSPAGGTNPVEVWITRRIVDARVYPELTAQLNRTWSELRTNGDWPFLYPLPGEPPFSPSRKIRDELRAALADASNARGFTMWNLWFTYALRPDLGELHDEARRRFLGHDLQDWLGYNLTHRFYAYRLMMATHPEGARRIGVPRQLQIATVQMGIEASLDVFLSDLFIERVAFLLDSDREPWLFSARWIERILEDQGADGGWAFSRSPRCAIPQLVGADCIRGPSHPHSTVLAALALSKFREHQEDRRGPRVAE